MKRRILLLAAVLAMFAIAFAGWWFGTSKQRELRFRTALIEVPDNPLDISYGSDTARLTIYMFVSYTCRHCRAFLNLDLEEIQSRYIDRGEVRLVLKPIDLAENQDMMSALQLAVCMNQNGNADDMIELLLSDPSAVYSDEFRQLIDDIINGNPELAECLVSDNFSYLRQNNALFSALGSKGTPIFVIAGHVYGGRRSADQFCEIIDYELAKSN